MGTERFLVRSRHQRRAFIKQILVAAAGAGGAALPRLAVAADGGGQPETVIDTHVHFYDPARPSGVPWPSKDDAVLYRTVLPAQYAALQQPRPVSGVIVVEASPWLEDNQWVLDLAEPSRLILGLVGTLPVGEDGFEAQLKRFAAHRRFRGIRLRPSPPTAQWNEPRFRDHLRQLAEADLTLDLVGGLETLELAGRLANALPSLRIVIDHLAGVQVDGRAPAAAWLAALRTVARHEQVYMKISGLVEGTGRSGGRAPTELQVYQPTLDAVWEALGEDRLVYGSNWPVCEHYASLATVQRLAIDYFRSKGGQALAKVMAKNSQRAYQWPAR
jgi:L-fuconolactonase